MTASEAATPVTEPKPTFGNHRLYWLVLGLAVFVILADQLSKWWAESNLGNGEVIPVIGDFIQFWLVYNPGAAFSIGEEFTWVLAIVAAVAVVAIAWYAWRVRSRGWAVALGLLLGGATTHLGDRLFRQPGFGRGHVVDFIDYFGWFVGNIADIALVGGAIMIVVLSILGLRVGGDDPVDKSAAAESA
jgi:signal peptidase II